VAEAIISYQLDLILRLIDTTTGFPVPEQQVLFREDGQVLPLLRRDRGLYVLLNHGRSNMKLQVEVRGYEPMAIQVDYERLDPKLPELELPLIPLVKANGYEEFYTLAGRKSGLLSVMAVPVERPIGIVGKYLENRQLLKLFTVKSLDEKSYAILHKDSRQFEEIIVAKKPDRLTLKLLRPLKDGWKAEEPLTRIVRGRVEKNGTYLLRVRDLGGSNIYLVRYGKKDKTSYEQIDFSAIGKEDATWD
jgi:hypothetical protein